MSAIPSLCESDVVSAADVIAQDPVEDGVTFAENALIKARALAHHTGLIAIADDSGLSVEVMGGVPGIFSARWAGTHGDDHANLELLLAQLADIRAPHRRAAFICAAAVVDGNGFEHVSFGRLDGTLTTEPRGQSGFGYDPILQPDGMSQTCAQLSVEEKNAISHRGQAFRELAPAIERLLDGVMT